MRHDDSRGHSTANGLPNWLRYAAGALAGSVIAASVFALRAPPAAVATPLLVPSGASPSEVEAAVRRAMGEQVAPIFAELARKEAERAATAASQGPAAIPTPAVHSAPAEAEAQAPLERLLSSEGAVNAGFWLEHQVKVGTWTNESRGQLRDQLNGLSTDERYELLRRLSVAINTGQLKVETDGPPL